MSEPGGGPGKVDGRQRPEERIDETAGMSPMAKVWVEMGPYLGIGWVWVVSIAAFGGLGYWLDGKLGTGRKLFIAGCVFGIAIGFVNFFKVVMAVGRRKKR